VRSPVLNDQLTPKSCLPTRDYKRPKAGDEPAGVVREALRVSLERSLKTKNGTAEYASLGAATFSARVSRALAEGTQEGSLILGGVSGSFSQRWFSVLPR